MCAGSIRVLLQSLIPESLLRRNKEQIMDQCFKFTFFYVLAFAELKFRYLPRFHPRKLHG